MASDGVNVNRGSRLQAADSGFRWVTSSPSPVEVASLEARFPEVIRVPVEDLEAGAEEWLGRAVIARSYQRWIPAEAFLREFRRAGVAGAIAPISMAHRCHVFRFEDSDACSLVLNRPWVINGQAVGMEAWAPEFFPAADSIASALIWVRLPNLPLEFWKEGILRRLVQPAGSLCMVDAATQQRSRGGFARVCLRVDLKTPLRPGIRVQGMLGTFWQPFVYENLGGICMDCGTLHLEGSCSAQADSEGGRSEKGTIYGPWLSAVRVRQGAAGIQGGMRRKGDPAAGGLQGGSVAPVDGPGSSQGWQFPSRVARRRILVSKARKGDGLEPSEVPEPLSKGISVASKDVPVEAVRAGLKMKGKMHCAESSVAVSSSILNIEISPNPFASLGQTPEGGDLVVCREPGAGPIKRARPEFSPAPRAGAKPVKSKGKGQAPKLSSNKDSSSSALVIQPSSGLGSGQEGVMIFTAVGVGGGGPEDMATSMPKVLPAQEEVLNDDVDELMLCSSKNPEDDTQAVGCLDDSAMVEDQEVVTSSSS